MKGDYSQPGLMPGYCSEQIDLPSACLCGGKSSPAAGTTFRRKAGPPFVPPYIGPILARFSRNYGSYWLKGVSQWVSQQIFLEVSDQPASLTNRAGFVKQCGFRQKNSPATSETTFALRATARPQSGKGRAIAKRRRNSAAFWREEFKNSLF